MTPSPAPPKDKYRRSFTLSREVDRATGTIETRHAARQRYETDGLPVPEATFDYGEDIDS